MRFVDHEDWLSPSSPPTLKAVFDNLRNYPLLAVYFAASMIVYKTGKFASEPIAYLMFFIFGVLFLLSLMQTLVLVTGTLLNFIFPNGTKPKVVYFAPAVAFVLLFGYATFFSMLVITHQLTESAIVAK